MHTLAPDSEALVVVRYRFPSVRLPMESFSRPGKYPEVAPEIEDRLKSEIPWWQIENWGKEDLR